MKCEHEFVRSGYGNDLICTKCCYAAMQATIEPKTNTSVNITINNPSRETVEELSKSMAKRLRNMALRY